MTDISPSSSVEATSLPSEQRSGGWSIQKIAITAVIGLAAAIVLLFLIALVLAIRDVDRAAPIIQILRDLFIIVLALESILICFALVVLIAQVARLINLLQNEFKPILQNTQETVKSAKGTVEFVGNNVTEPIVRVSSFAAGLGVLVRELGGIRRALRSNHQEVNGDDKHPAKE